MLALFIDKSNSGFILNQSQLRSVNKGVLPERIENILLYLCGCVAILVTL